MNGTEAAPTPSGKRRTWLIVVPALLLVLVASYMVWDNMYGASAKKRVKEREDQAQTERYHAYLKNFEDAMRADTYGGSTPEETLQLFITALKAGDIDLASRYFALETNENSPDYLTRNKIVPSLQKYKLDSNKEMLLSILGNTQPSISNNSIDDGDYELVSLNSQGQVKLSVLFILNKHSRAWKIQSM